MSGFTRQALRLRALVRVVRPYWLYAVAALAVLGPLLRPGYIFATDMVFTPVMPLPAAGVSNYLPQLALHYLSLAIPSMLLQKFLLFGALAGAGIGAHRLLLAARPARVLEGNWRPAVYVGALVYMVNPFVYSRFMAGQYYVLLGYALLPVVLAALLRLWRQPGRTAMLRLAIYMSVLAAVSIHTAGIALAAAGVLCAAAYSWRDRSRAHRWWTVLRYGSGAVGLMALLSSYWLVPLLLGHGDATIFQGFTAADRAAFATAGTGLGRLGNVLALQGFWADNQQLYLVPRDVLAWWWLPLAGLGTLVMAGAAYAWRVWRRALLACAATIVIGALLAGNMALDGWLAGHIPFFAGYREPQKFAMLLAVAYAWLAALGTVAAMRHIRQWRALHGCTAGLLAVIATLPLLATPLLLWGANGQLRAADYPADWYRANTVLATIPGNRTALFLPWHLYMRMDFAGTVIANPAPQFFDVPIVSSNDPEFQGASGYSHAVQEQDIQRLLSAAPARTGLARQLSERNIAYVILAGQADYRQYAFIARQPGLRTMFAGQDITIYRVEH